MSSKSPERLYDEFLERMKKRRNHLASRINRAAEEHRTLTYDEAEYNMLNFTIDLYTTHPAVVIDHIDEWRNR